MSEQMIPAGFYRARAVAGSEQHGTTSNGFDQVAFDVVLTDGEYAGLRLTTFLVFSDASSKYSLDRLKACGWSGGNDLGGIDRNEVTVQVKYEQYQGKQQLKVEIQTGGGRVELKNPMSEAQKRGFYAKLNELDRLNGNAPAQAQRPPMQQQTQQGQGYPPSWDDNRGPPPAKGTQPYKL